MNPEIVKGMSTALSPYIPELVSVDDSYLDTKAFTAGPLLDYFATDLKVEHVQRGGRTGPFVGCIPCKPVRECG